MATGILVLALVALFPVAVKAIASLDRLLDRRYGDRLRRGHI